MIATAAARSIRLRNRQRPYLQRLLDPLRLRLLFEVERLGSITRAAEACSMGQSTASTHLRTLESAVGHRLYERAGRATRLTEAGQLLTRHAAVVLSSLDLLEENLAALEDGLTGTLRLATCEEFGIHVLPDVLATFASHSPGAQIQVRVVSSDEVVRAVVRRDVHLGIAAPTRRPAGLQAEPLLTDELVWIAAGDNSASPMLVPGTLQGLTVILPGAESSVRAVAEQALARAGCSTARTLELDSVEAIKRAVRSGVGVAPVLRLAAADELARGALRELALPGVENIELPIELISTGQHQPTPLERIFQRIVCLHCLRLGGERKPELTASS